MTSFRDAIAKLADTAQLNATSAASSQSSVVTVSASSTAQAADYAVDITQLAQAQSLVSGNFGSTSDVVGSGTLTIAVGTPTYNAAPNQTTYASFSQTSSVDITIAATLRWPMSEMPLTHRVHRLMHPYFMTVVIID